MKIFFKHKEYDKDKMLKKHGIHYNTDDINEIDIQIEKLDQENIDEIKKIIIDRREKRQKYLWEGLTTGNAEEEHIEKILDIALREIDKQETVKQHVETKAGIVLAFFGVVVGILFQSKEIMGFIKDIFCEKAWSVWKIGLCIIATGWFASGVLIITYAIETLRCREYNTFLLNDEMLKAACADKKISLAALLETAIHVSNRNTVLNNRKGIKMNKLIKCVVFFTICTVTFMILFFAHQIF